MDTTTPTLAVDTNDPAGPPPGDPAPVRRARWPWVLGILGVLVGARVFFNRVALQPVAMTEVPAPEAASAECTSLIDALPSTLADLKRAELAEPAPEGAAAWQADADPDPVILRCGLGRPDDFVVSSPLQVVDDVSWFRIGDQGRTTWVAVDRPVYVALTLPDGSGPTPIQLMSGAVAKAMPAVKPSPGPVR